MKKTISILLALGMILSLTACLRLKTPAAAKAKSEAQPTAVAAAETTEVPAATAAPTEEPAPTEAPTLEPTEAPTPAPTDTPAPTEAPTPTPEPTEVPFDVVVADAVARLEQVRSMHIDIKLNLAIAVKIAMGGMDQSMPMEVNMFCRMDTSKDPDRAKLNVDLSIPGQDEMSGIVYVARDGADLTLYYSEDNGATWKKQTNPKNAQLPQSPEAAMGMLTGEGASFQRTGTAQVNGKTAAVYSGKVDGKYLQDILNSAGAGEEMAEAFGADLSGDILASLGKLEVTLMIDEETGLPVRYIVDMTDAVKDLIEAALVQSMGGMSLSEAGVTFEIPTAVLDMVLSQFDSVEPIVIPEAALNAPEA